jgi:acyl-CoA thioesterase
MDSRAFLDLRSSHNPYRWSLEVGPGLVTRGGFLFGGCGLGAAISALEGTSGRQCVWATAQYLAYATGGEVVDVDVTIAVEGHQITQARAVCHVGNREILTVNAALGHRPLEQAGQW